MRTRFFLIFLFTIFNFGEINSKSLVFDISQKEVLLKKNSKIPDFTVFGVTDSKNPVVLKIMGPKQKVILQKKKKTFGMWTWNKTGEFSYPGLFHYYTNIKNDEIDFEIKKNLVDNIKLIGKDDDNLKKELIEKKLSIELFQIKNNAFKPINDKQPDFFKIPVKLPVNAPSGVYNVSLSMIDSGNILETPKIEILIKKPGVSSLIFKFAHKFSFLYAIFSVMIAIVFGLTAGVLFRK